MRENKLYNILSTLKIEGVKTVENAIKQELNIGNLEYQFMEHIESHWFRICRLKYLDSF